MTEVARNPLFRGSLDPEAARVSRTVVGAHTMAVAEVANAALLDGPAGRFTLSDLAVSSVYSIGYTPSPGARYLFLRWRVARSTSLTDTAAVDLGVTDAAAHSLASSSSTVPNGFKGETFFARYPFATDRFTDAAEQTGVIDLDAMRATLSDPDWSLDFTVTLTGSAEVQQIEGWEVPRFVIDESTAGRGIIPGDFTPGRLVTNATPTGLQRLLATIEAARTGVRHVYLSLAFPQGITSATPSTTTSAAFGPITLLDEAATYETWKLYVRRLYTGASAGEPIKARVLYRFSAGAAETLKWRFNTGATGSPFTSNNLAYTTSWTWSPWLSGSLKTNGTSGYDLLGPEAKLSAAGPTWHIAGVQIVSDAA